MIDGMMRRFDLVLLASVRLCGARQPSFSIQDDMLAYPQYEVVFLDSYILRKDALALVQGGVNYDPIYVARFSEIDLTSKIRASTPADAGNSIQDPNLETDGGKSSSEDDDGDGAERQVAETYEIMNFPPASYLCAVPVLAPPLATSQTATELAKAEQARELARANERGWKLIADLEGHCLFFLSGWWSYRFCYGKDIVQFHEEPRKTTEEPSRDVISQGYILGVAAPVPDSDRRRLHDQDSEGAGAKSTAPPNTELQVKANQLHLVQRLGGGTLCDLTDRERSIEIQYQCNPGTHDRIAWIKEVTTCMYLMLVHTPRLCDDPAFLPPKETRAHPINCRPIVSSDDEAATWRERKAIEASKSGVAETPETPQASKQDGDQKQQGAKEEFYKGMTVGGLVVGGHQLLGLGPDGQPTARLPPPTRHFPVGDGADRLLIEILAASRSKADGGQIEVVTDERLEEMELDPEEIRKVQRELKKLAGDNSWRLEVVEVDVPGQLAEREIRGIVEGGDQETEAGFEKTYVYDDRRYDDERYAKGHEGPWVEEEVEEEEDGSHEVFFHEEL